MIGPAKWFAIFLCFAFVSCKDVEQPAYQVEEPAAYFLCSATDVRIRSGPGINFPILATINFGDKLQLVEAKAESNAGWRYLQTNSGIKGYISAEFVMPIASDLSEDQGRAKLITQRVAKRSFSLREYKDLLAYLRKWASQAQGQPFYTYQYYTYLQSVSELFSESKVKSILSDFDDKHFLPGEEGYQFDPAYYFRFVQRYPNFEHSEDLFWEALNLSELPYCENYFLCELRNKQQHELSYLTRYPDGKYSEQARAALRDFLFSFPGLEDAKPPLSKVKASYAEIEKELSRIDRELSVIINSDDLRQAIKQIKESIMKLNEPASNTGEAETE